jgi:hypothetical protein
VLGLDLSSAEAIVRTAVGVPSVERPPVAGVTSERTDPRWGAMLRIDPSGDAVAPAAAYSYLFYKLSGDGPLHGMRMPPPDAPPLAPAELATVADWIARGAPAD